MPKPIPLVDLKAQYRSLAGELDAAIQETIEATAFIMGDRVRSFEAAFAAYCGAGHGVACSSGTTAIHLALIACGVGPGDEVIVPSMSFIASAGPVCHCGAVPVFADVDPETYTLDPASVEALVTERTKAIMPVHLYGQCADMDALQAVARRHGLKVVEDCAQSHGAVYRGRTAGSIGDFGCFSFFPGKNLGAYGDAGMLVTNDEAAARHLSKLSNHGRSEKYKSDEVGYNYRMDALQAAILSVKLQHLPAWTEARQRHAHRYNDLLESLPLTRPAEKEGHVYHLYVLQSDDRDALLAGLKGRDIAAGIHYPIPLHLQPCFEDPSRHPEGSLPVSEALARRVFSIPLYPELEAEQQDRVADALRSMLALDGL